MIMITEQKPLVELMQSLNRYHRVYLIGCGTCVGGCPSDAISLNHFTNEQILAEMEGMLV